MASRFNVLVWLLACFLCFTARMEAHPVAQGSVEVRANPGELVTLFRISNEQIFVAGTFGANAPKQADSFEALCQYQSSYLLKHVAVAADDVVLQGECIRVTIPSDKTIKGFTEFELRYPLPATPRRIVVKQTLLNEIEFAPGNQWEASFAAKILKDGRVIEEARLLSTKQPLEVSLASSIASEFSEPVQRRLGRLAFDFFLHGMHHIAAGWDHALFVAALVLAVSRFWHVVGLVTAFTVAHTITLTLAILRIASLPREWVEPMIALSIVAGALLNFHRPRDPSLGPRLAVAFGFGLFHGLGFASGLVQAMQGFSAGAIAAAITGFSFGVEVGHQIVVIPLVLVMLAIRKWLPAAVPWAVRIGSAAIAAAGIFLLVLLLR